jgi:pimeloyl-ACP methyl ester carboxylesterase
MTFMPDLPFQVASPHRYATVNGVRLHYVEYGKGPLILLLHGFPECWYAWRYQLPALAQAGFRVVAPDLRGYNLSDKPRGVHAYRMECFIGDVKGLIQTLGEDRAVVVGHDWGGVIAWQLAISEPQMVKKLIILNAPHPQRYLEALKTPGQLLRSWYVLFFQLPWLPELMIRSFGFAGLRQRLLNEPVHADAFDEVTVKVYQRALGQPGALTAALNYYRAGFRSLVRGLRPNIQPIEMPTLVIWGEQDRYLGADLLEGLEPWVKDLTVERFADASHWVQAEVPERVNERMLQFLRPPRRPSGLALSVNG